MQPEPKAGVMGPDGVIRSLAEQGRINELLALLGAIRKGNPDAARAAIVLHNEHAKAIAMYVLKALEGQTEA